MDEFRDIKTWKANLPALQQILTSRFSKLCS